MSEIVDTLDIPQETVYDYVQNLEIADPVEKFREQRPYEYDTEAIALTLSTDGETQAITLPLSRLLPAAMRTRSSMSISSGMALTASLPPLSTPTSTSGTVNHRIAARELDLSPLEPKSSCRRWSQSPLNTPTRLHDDGLSR